MVVLITRCGKVRKINVEFEKNNSGLLLCPLQP